MMRRLFGFAGLIAFALGIAIVGHQPAPVSAGGWPCFMCHGGFEVLGTDLAPQLAGSKLTDEQVLAQVRKPRGVMPAFSAQEIPDQALKDGFIQPFVRGMPAGKATATLDAQTRAMALATIAAVAATRSVESARLTGSIAIETPAPAPHSPNPAALPAPSASPVPRDLSAFGAFAAIGAVLIGAVVATRWWMRK